MAHTVVRGKPYPAQLYLEKIIQELVAETGRPEDRHCFSRILFKCLRDNPERMFMTEGISGQELTNAQLLRSGVQVARALEVGGVKRGDTVFCVSWNRVDFASLYFGCIFAGVIMLNLESVVTPNEIKHYMQIRKPKLFFSEENKASDVKQALEESQSDCPLVIFCENTKENDSSFTEFVKGCSMDNEGYFPVPTDPDDVMMLFSTSGSTSVGLPKIAMSTHKGFIAQSGCDWNFKPIPHLDELLYLIDSAQWTLHARTITSSVVFGRRLLVQSERGLPETMLKLIKQYKPTNLTLTPTEISDIFLYADYKRGDLDSVKMVVTLGSNLTRDFLERIKNELPEGCIVENHYGMTEAHGLICVHDDYTPVLSVGRVSNILSYKIVDEGGNVINEPNQHGELKLKSEYSLVKMYLNDRLATASMYDTEGWFCTGDLLYRDENKQMFFFDRKKFLIFHNSVAISPVELERVIYKLDGVASCVVCGTEKGPGALIVVKEGANVTTKMIKDKIQDELNEFKRLTGCIAFVDSLPRTSTGKISRAQCKLVLDKLIEDNYDNRQKKISCGITDLSLQ